MNMSNNESPETSVPVSFADFPPFLNPPISLAKQPSTEQKQILPVNCIGIPCEDEQWSSEHQEYDECLDEEEALELIDYKDTRKPLLNNSSLSPEARDPTMKDFPELLKAHKLDERLQLQVVGQLPEANSVGGAAALSSAVPLSPPVSGSPPSAPPGPSQPPPGPGLGPSPKMKFIVSRDCKKAVCNRKRKYERMERRQQMRKRKCEQLEGGSVSNTIQEKGPATIRLAVRPSDATTVHTIENSTWFIKDSKEFLDGHGKKKPRLADTSETRADSEDEPTDNTNKANPQPDERRDSFVQDNRCPICLELFVNVRILSCSHVFCETCIAKWMKKSKSCPMCKQTIEGKPVPCNTLDNDINELVKCFLPKEAQKERAELLKERAEVLEESVSPRRALVPYSDTSDSES